MSKAIGIIGCGWLGTPLAVNLLGAGHTIKGTTTSPTKLKNLRAKGIDAAKISILENGIKGEIQLFLKDLNVLILNIPPKRRDPDSGNFLKKMEVLLDEIKKSEIQQVLFISSTSVYGNVEGDITEETVPKPISPSANQLLQVENLLMAQKGFSTSIIRFGGLIGKDRHPVHYLSGRKMKNGEELVNLIHLNDCIHMIKTILENDYWNGVFNGVYPYHPTKEEYYTSEAKKRGIPVPIYIPSDQKIFKKKVVFRNFYVKKHHLTTSLSS